MQFLRNICPFVLAIIIVISVAVCPAVARANGGTIEAKFIGDRILIPVILRTRYFEKPTHIIVDIGAEDAFVIHDNIYAGVRFGEGEDTLKALGPDFSLAIPRGQIVPYPDGTPPMQTFSRITSLYDVELENVDVIASVGFPLLKQFNLSVDPEEGTLTLSAPTDQDANLAREAGYRVIENVKTHDDKLYLPLSDGPDTSAYMVLETDGYHTYVNKSLARSAGDSIYIGHMSQNLRLSGMSALYPINITQQYADEIVALAAFKDFVRKAKAEGQEGLPPLKLTGSVPFPDNILIRSGLSLLSAYKFEVNASQNYVAFSRFKDSNFSDADFDFYTAASSRDYEGLVSYFAEHNGDRNIEEAAGILFDLGMDQNRSFGEQFQAVQFGLTAVKERRKTDYIAGFLGAIYAPEVREKYSQLTIKLAEEAMKYIGRSQNPAIRQDLQMVLGDRYLAVGENKMAWKYIFAAAFNGDPNIEGFVRHELGRAYEAMGRYRRAYSNYKRTTSKYVTVSPETLESAKAGMQRLKPKLDSDDPLLLEDVE